MIIFSLCLYLFSFHSYLAPLFFNCKVIFQALACLKLIDRVWLKQTCMPKPEAGIRHLLPRLIFSRQCGQLQFKTSVSGERW